MSVKQVVGFVLGVGAVVATIATAGLALPITTKLLIAAGVLLASSVGNALLRGQPNLQDRQGRFLQQRTSPEEPLPLLYGEAKLGAILVDLRVDETSTDNRRLLVAAAFCQGSHPDAPNAGEIESVEEIWFDDRLAWTLAGGVQPPFGFPIPLTNTDPIEAVNVHLGSTTQAVDALLNGTFPTQWPTTSQLRGVAYVVLEMWRWEDVYPTGFPRITAVVRGRHVHDPRDDAWKYSQNAALVVRDYLREPIAGGGVPDAELDDAAFEAEANYCDETVDTFPRFELHGPVPTQQAVQQNLLEMMVCCRMNLPYVGGLFVPHIRKAQASTGIVLDESNIVEGTWSFVRAGSRDAPNVGRGTFVYPGKEYEPDTVQWPEPGDANPYLAEDNAHEARLDLDLPYLNHRQRVLQLIATLVKEGRQDIVAAVTAKDDALALQFGDVVDVSHGTPAWDAKPFWVLPLAILSNGTVQLLLSEYDPSVYDDETTASDPAIPDTGFPDPLTVAAPTNLALDGSVAAAQQNADGSYVPQIVATWDRPDDPFVVEYELRARIGSADWETFGPVPVRDTQTPPDRSEFYTLTPVRGGQTYTVEVRAVNSLGVRSAWVGDTVAVAAGPPVVTGVALSYDEDGFLRAEVSTVNAGSIRIAFNNGSAPSDAAILAGTIVATDANGQAVAFSPAAIPIGTTAFAGVAAFEQAGAAGAVSPIRKASITRSSPGPSSAVPTPFLDNVVYAATQVTLDLDATQGVDGLGPLEVRFRTFLGGSAPGAFGAWAAAPVTGIVVARHAYELTFLEAQARDVGFATPVVGELPFLFVVQPQNLVNIGADPDTGDAVPASELMPRDNLVLNPGFERGVLSPWEVASHGGATGWAARNGDARSGSWCVQFDSTAQTGIGRLSANGPRLTFPGGHAQAREGDVFFMEGWGRRLGAGPANTMRLEIVFRDAAGTSQGGTATQDLTTPTATYQRIEVRGTAPAGTVYATFGLVVLNSGNAETHLFDDVQVERLHTAERIPDAAIITRTINDLAVEWAKLGPRAVAIDKLFVGSFDNLIANPGFEEGGGSLLGWSQQTSGGGSWVFEGTTVRAGVGALRYDTTGQSSAALFNARRGGGGTVQEQCFAAAEGDEFYLEVFARCANAAAANDVDVQILFYDATSGTALQTTTGAALAPTTTFQRASVQAVAPAGTAFVQFRLRVQNDGNDNDLIFDDAYARRMVTGSLVVDGTILAQHLTVATLDAISADVGVLTAGRIENAAGDAGILLSGTLPGGWTTYLDLTAAGDDALLLHDALELYKSGGGLFRGALDLEFGGGGPVNPGDAYIRFRDPDVAHGATSVEPTDVRGAIRAADVVGIGGLIVRGLTEGSSALQFVGYVTTEITTKSTAFGAAIDIVGRTISGTGSTTMGADANILAVREATVTRFILDADGDSHQDVGTAWTNFDAFDDAALLDGLAVAVARPGDPLRSDMNAWLLETREQLEALGIVTFNEDGHHFANMSRLTMLLVGAVRQLADRVAALERPRLEEA